MKTIIDFLKYVIEEAGPGSLFAIPIIVGSICGAFYCVCWCLNHFFIAPFLQ